VAERFRADLAQRLTVHLQRPGQHLMIVATGATHAVKEMVDLVDQRFEQRPGGGFNVREQRAQGGILSFTVTGGKGDDRLLAANAAVLQNARLVFDLAAETENGVRVALEKTFLLLLEQAKKFAVFSEFLPETFSDALPVHN
jgi:hypothetical protein